MNISTWIHHLLNPHCDKCDIEKECKSCEVLKHQLEVSNYEKKLLLNSIVTPSREVTKDEFEDINPILPQHKPWKVRRELLEAEDRERARLLKHATETLTKVQVKSTEELEKEVGIVKEA